MFPHQGRIHYKAVKTHSYVREWLHDSKPHEPKENDPLGLRGCNMAMIDEVAKKRHLQAQQDKRLLAKNKKRKFKPQAFDELLAMVSVGECKRLPDENGRPKFSISVLIGFDKLDDFSADFSFELRYRTPEEAKVENVMAVDPPDLGSGPIANKRAERIGFLLSLLVKDALAQMTKYHVNPDGSAKIPFNG